MKNLFVGCAAAMLAAWPGTSAAEVVASGETGFVVRSAATVKADPAKAWLALIAPASWWNGDHTFSGDAKNLYIDAQATGCFCEKLPLTKDAPAGSRPGSIEHMHVIYAAPSRVLRMSGGLGPLQSEAVHATLTITLKAGPEGTRILWEYVVGGYLRSKFEALAPVVDKVLSEQVSRLAAHIDGAPPQADAKAAKPG